MEYAEPDCPVSRSFYPATILRTFPLLESKQLSVGCPALNGRFVDFGDHGYNICNATLEDSDGANFAAKYLGISRDESFV